MGDLVIATPFLRAACREFQVTLIAKPYAQNLHTRLWPEVEVIPFTAPWTAFQGKYRLWKWPWQKLYGLRRQIASQRFDVGLSARWDPRDHFLLRAMGVKRRLGFPRLGSRVLLTDPVERPAPNYHRYEYWRTLGRSLKLELPVRANIVIPRGHRDGAVLVHTGAGQPIRVWPLERYHHLVQQLRTQGYRVLLACDPDQVNWWRQAGESEVATPRTVNELLTLIDQAGAFIGNDSGPGHLAAFCGVPTFTLFGPQLWEWFSPLHPDAVCIEGNPCPYKPCSDYCRFPTPHCLRNISFEEVQSRVDTFLKQHLYPAAGAGLPGPAAV